MTLAATFLGGAKSRLLPASIPFRFFVSAALFHVAMWLALLAAPAEVADFRGGLGFTLAALHLLTLGVLTTTAIGASVQLLPVATRRSLAAVWPVKLVFWLMVPGLVVLIAAMQTGAVRFLIAGAVATGLGLLLFAGLLANNLWRAASLPVVAAYGWAALAGLILLVTFGFVLALDYEIAFVPDHAAFALSHLILGGFGFMGLLALGFSHILVPMFALSSAPPQGPAVAGLVLAVAAVLIGTLGALAASTVMLTAAALVGLAAAALHLRLMFGVLGSGMRKRLGFSFLLIRAAWFMLPATLVVGLAALYGHGGRNAPALFGLFLFIGWLLTFLLGILQRIVPFLASMHASKTKGSAPPLMSELTAATPLRLHAACHASAFVLLAVGIAADAAEPVRIGSAIGVIGAVAFAWFTIAVARRAIAGA